MGISFVKSIKKKQKKTTSLLHPTTYAALPLPIPPTLPIPVPLVVLDAGAPLAIGGGAAILEPPLEDPATDPVVLATLLDPLVPLVGAGFFSAAFLLASASAAALSRSAILSRSASLRRSASCALFAVSASMSSRSCVAPCQWPDRRRRCVCSVCDRMRIHRSRSVFAFATVCETVCSAYGLVSLASQSDPLSWTDLHVVFGLVKGCDDALDYAVDLADAHKFGAEDVVAGDCVDAGRISGAGAVFFGGHGGIGGGGYWMGCGGVEGRLLAWGGGTGLARRGLALSRAIVAMRVREFNERA